MGDGGYAWFAVNCAGGAAFGAKRRPIKKIERDGDKALGGRRFFIFKQQPTKRWHSRWGGVLGKVRARGGTRGGGRFIIVWGDEINDKKN